MYVVKTKLGKDTFSFSTKKQADDYAKLIGGKTVTLTRNPIVSWQEKDDSLDYAERLHRLDGYNERSKAFCREIIQNSIDADATSIKFIFAQTKDGQQILRCADNGKGMKYDEVLPFMLTTGGTGKGNREDESSSFGGFGDAKTLILLPWRSWRVVTTTGKTGSITVADCPVGGKSGAIDLSQKLELPNIVKAFPEKSHKGTIIDILGWTDERYKLFLHNFLYFIETCNLPDINIDVIKIEQPIDIVDFSFDNSFDAITDSIYAQRYQLWKPKANLKLEKKSERAKFTMPDGKVAAVAYFERHTDVNAYSKIIYRGANGVACWTEDLPRNVHGLCIIELKMRSTLLLNEKRTGFSGKVEELKNQVENWVKGQLITDPRSVARVGEKSTQAFQGFGGVSARALRASDEARIALENLRNAGGVPTIEQVNKIAKDAAEKIKNICSSENTESPVPMLPQHAITKLIEFNVNSVNAKDKPTSAAEKFETMHNAVKRMLHIPDYCLHVEPDFDLKGFKVPKEFKPDSMSPKVKRLLSVWTEACRLVVMKLGCQESFGVGFCFSGQVLGLYMPVAYTDYNNVYNGARNGEAVPFILINPFRKKGSNEILDVDDNNSLKSLWATAIHEVTHMTSGESKHLEEFASAITESISICAASFPMFVTIASLSKISDKIEQEKFSADIDISEFEEIEKVGRARSKTEKILERQLCEAIVSSIKAGNPPPDIDNSDLKKILTDKSKSEIASAIKFSSSTQVVSSYNQQMHQQVIDSLRAQLRVAREKTQTLESQIENLTKQISEPVSVTADKPLKLVPITALTKPYKRKAE